ncbi:hypothetical protein [Rhizobium sp. 007]|uniref:hypothetical protein n=1 Tax=Rhizobium sp. 007 TaxID=2785056 RepID=UPI001FEF485E|nr:hypothetical protein [Rhizobium sp. 007]
MIERAPAAVPTILTVIGTTTALYFADAVLAPVAGALFIIAILWPLQSRLQVHLPRVLALAIVAALLLGIFLVFMSLLTLSFGRIGRSLMADVGQFQLLYTRLAEWLEGHGIPLGGVWADNFNSRVLLRVLQGISARLNTMSRSGSWFSFMSSSDFWRCPTWETGSVGWQTAETLLT